MLLEEIRNIKSTRRDLRNFGLSVGLVLVALGGLLLWRERPAYPYLLGIGLALAVAGLMVPRLLLPLQKAWMAFAVVMGWVMTRVILSVLFFLVITPISLASRVFGGRFLDLGWDRNRESYWVPRKDESRESADYERQF